MYVGLFLYTRTFNPFSSVWSAGAGLGGPLGGWLNDQFGWYDHFPNDTSNNDLIFRQEDSIPISGRPHIEL